MVYFRYIAYISEISLGAIRGNVRCQVSPQFVLSSIIPHALPIVLSHLAGCNFTLVFCEGVFTVTVPS